MLTILIAPLPPNPDERRHTAGTASPEHASHDEATRPGSTGVENQENDDERQGNDRAGAERTPSE